MAKTGAILGENGAPEEERRTAASSPSSPPRPTGGQQPGSPRRRRRPPPPPGATHQGRSSKTGLLRVRNTATTVWLPGESGFPAGGQEKRP